MRAVDFVRHVQLLPRHDFPGRCRDDQRPCPFGQCRMGGKKRLHATRAGDAKSVDREPPAAPARNPHGQIGQRPDATRLQGGHHAWWQPRIDLVGDVRHRCWQAAQRLDRARDGVGRRGGSLAECFGEVSSVTARRERDQGAPNAAEHTARGCPWRLAVAQIARDGRSSVEPGVPSAQRSQFGVVGEGDGVGLMRFHDRQFRAKLVLA